MIGRVRRRFLSRTKKQGRRGEEEEDVDKTEAQCHSIISPILSTSSTIVPSDSVESEEGFGEKIIHISKSCNDVDVDDNRIGKYLIVELLATSSATVYKAEYVSRGGRHIKVVLKKQELISPRSHKFISRARMESMILLELNKDIYKHQEGYPYIIKMIDEVYSSRLNTNYIVLEYCNYGSLIDHMAALDRPYSLEINRRLFMDIFLAIQFIHRLGIAHRDIKLDNILLQHNKQRVFCKLADFGLSVIMQPDLKDHSTVNSPRNAAPDLVKSLYEFHKSFEKDPFAVDIWALGVVVYSMTELVFPFEPDPPETPFEASLRMGNEETGHMTKDEMNSLYHKIFLNIKRPRENFLDDVTLNDFINSMLEYNDQRRFNIEMLVHHEFMQQNMRNLKLFDFSKATSSKIISL